MVRGHAGGASSAVERFCNRIALAVVISLYKVFCQAFKHIAMLCAQEQPHIPHTKNAAPCGAACALYIKAVSCVFNFKNIYVNCLLWGKNRIYLLK